MIKMKIKATNISFDVDITMTASDWELYTVDQEEKAEMCAQQINKTLHGIILEKHDSWRALYEACDKEALAPYAHMGAQDTEPHWHLIEILIELGMPQGIV